MATATDISNKIIEYSFYSLLFFVPLFLTQLNYELFEYNKMMLTYTLTVIIVGAWLIKMVSDRKIHIQRTPLDIPILLFAISQLLSAIFSIDRHVSIWGYYSRFHGGLLSTLTYTLLYYAAVSNLDKQKVIRGLQFTLLAGFLVAAYGVAEHFGIDAKYWVQDVKNRVFSTLGQPNWLAAYLSILIPITIGSIAGEIKLKQLSISLAIFYSLVLTAISFYLIWGQPPNTKLVVILIDVLASLSVAILFKKKILKWSKNIERFLLYLLVIIFYLALLYTKSRSGFAGFWVGNFIFWGILVLKFRKEIFKWFLILNSSFLILTFLVGSPFEQINKYFSFSGIESSLTRKPPPPPLPPQAGGTESGEIRKIVWKGAVDVWRHYPIFGSGVETFAFSYYQYRPVEHNMVSEWDFLYNKAHNEYLNFLATTGIFGLGSYLLLIFWFVWWNIKKISNFKFLISKQIPNLKSQKKLVIGHSLEISNWSLVIALLAAYISILVSNFFGFSVVIVALFFFLIPAFSFILTAKEEIQPPPPNHKPYAISYKQIVVTVIILFTIFYLLFSIVRLWWADVNFAKGYNLNRLEMYQDAYPSLKQAVKINSSEPFYHDELSSIAAFLAVEAARDKNATQAASLVKEAIEESQRAMETSPRNVNFWKTRTKVFYTLSALNEEYNQEALEAIKKAGDLAPTDPKIAYNVAILYGRTNDKKMAIKTLEETIKLKPDYRDAHYGLALYLEAEGKNEEATQHLKYILEKISPEDEQTKDLLNSWGINP